MKLAGRAFTPEELALCFVFFVFFAGIFAGAWQFNADSALFPIMLSVPGLLLLALYMMQGALPDGVRRAISSSDRFVIGNKPSVSSVSGEHDTKTPPDETGVYFIFVFTTGFAVAAWAVGFYLAACLAIGAYLYRSRAGIGGVPVIAAVLVVIAFGMIFTFDSAFGHHYADGALLSLRW